MWPLIVLLFGVSCQPQSVAPQSFLVTSSRNAEEVYLYAYGTPDGRVFDYTVPKAAFGELPAWEVKRDPPPFAVARALEIAEKTSRGEHPEITEFMPANISLQRVGHDERRAICLQPGDGRGPNGWDGGKAKGTVETQTMKISWNSRREVQKSLFTP
jgi:hypothetical protein